MPRDTLSMVEGYTAAGLKLAAGIGLTATGQAGSGVPLLLTGLTNATVDILVDTGVLKAKAEALPVSPTPAPAVQAATPAKDQQVLVGHWGEENFASSWVDAGKVESLRASIGTTLYVKVRRFSSGTEAGKEAPNPLEWIPAGSSPGYNYTLVTKRDNAPIEPPPRG